MKKIKIFAALATLLFSGSALGDKIITPEELLKHSTEKDCWMAIDGTVYDMSPYIALHREECKKMNFAEHCGTDASSVWKQKEASKSPHKKKSQRSLLKSKIGTFSSK